MTYSAQYRSKRRTAQEAAGLVRSGDWVDYGFALNMPVAFDEALAARSGEIDDVKIRGTLALKPLKAAEAEGFSYNSWHFSGYERKLAAQGRCHYLPMLYRNMPLYYRRELTVDVAVCQVAPIDHHGHFSFSISNSASRAILAKAGLVIVEVNQRMPRALGGFAESIHISDVDVIIEGANPPLSELPPSEPSEIEKTIASLLVEQIPDGATLQLGIGGLPNAIGHLLASSGCRDLGMHTEMLCDAFLELHRSGKLTNRLKERDRHKGVWSFAAGSDDLYRWIDDNPGLASYPIDYTNDPAVIACHDDMISINSCLEVDLFGQVSSESAGFRQISGTGGQLDFVEGAFKALRGKAFLCLASTFTDPQNGARRSRIVGNFDPGTIVTATRSGSHFIVTEWGLANLAGKSTWERSEALIAIAHPDFRDDLVAKAERAGIWRRSNRRG